MKKNIYYKSKIIGEIIYKKGDKWADEVNKVIGKKYSLLQKFFGFGISPIKICLLYSRAEADKYCKTKTPFWLCGFTKDKRIYMLSPSISQKVSEHSKNSMYKVIIHEITHLFVKKINPSPFIWLNEGLALFLANQVKNNAIKKKDWKFWIKNGLITNTKISLKIFGNRSGYQISYNLVNFLFKYKKETIKDLLKINITDKNSDTLKKQIKNTLNLTESEFIKKLEEKIKFL